MDVVKVTTNPSGAVKASFPGINPILTTSRAQPSPLKIVSTENKRKREEIDPVKSKRIEIEPSISRSSSIAETTTKVDTAIERLAASSALPIQDIYKLYHENYNLSVRSFLELLSDKTAEKMDKAFIQELKKIES